MEAHVASHPLPPSCPFAISPLANVLLSLAVGNRFRSVVLLRDGSDGHMCTVIYEATISERPIANVPISDDERSFWDALRRMIRRVVPVIRGT